MRRQLGLHTVFAVAVLVASSDVVAAHELGSNRFTAPIPLSMLFLGAGATVALTAGWLARREVAVPASRRRLVSLPGRVTRLVSVVARTTFSVLVVFVVIRGLFGRQVPAENVATVFVWPVWLKGLGILAILLGSPWLVLSPWRGIHAAFERLEGDSIRLQSYPSWLGVWPAVVGFVLVVGIVENLTGATNDPAETAGLVALYAALMVGGGLLFGTAWFRHADFVEVLFAQFGRVAPFQADPIATDSGTGWATVLRYPWQGCTTAATRPGLVTFVVAMVYTVTFDGFTNTPEYRSLHFALQDTAGVPGATGVLLYLAGLSGFVLTFLVAMRLVAFSGGSDAGIRATARAFAPTVVPIAAAYEIAHNYPFVLRNLARLLELANRALLGGDATVTFLGWLSVPAFWASQVVLIVLGHAVAVVAAHAVAVDRYDTPARARRAHLPLVVVMVAYTVISLWIVSRPIVTG